MPSRLLALLFVLATVRASAAEAYASADLLMDVREVSLLELTDATGIALTYSVPAQPGDPPVGGTNATKRLHYTAIGPLNTARQILVGYQTGSNPPAGTGVSVNVSGIPTGCGIPSPSLPVTISTTGPMAIITGIDGCATGTPPGTGPLLTYTLVVTDATQLAPNAGTTVTVVYTLSAAQ